MRPHWVTQTVVPDRKRFFAIHCFTCKKNVPTKQYLKLHRGCEVHYVDKDGRVDED